MKFKKIIGLDFSGDELEPAIWKQIDRLCDQKRLMSRADLGRAAVLTDGLLVRLGAKVGRELIDQLPNLKYIGMLGTGCGGIDTAYAATKGVIVTNIADYATEAVAEFSFGILLEHLRDIARARQQAKAGNYSDDSSGSEIRGQHFGVVGLGHIGRRTAELAQAFGAEVSYWSRSRKPDAEAAGIRSCGLDELLQSSDIVTLNLALNPETEGIINTDRINKIKPGAIFINPSPMELVDFPALVARLKKNDVTFMLDHSDEISQAQQNTLMPIDNCIVYPAIAYLTREASQLKKRIYVDNLKSFLAGRPSNVVNA